MIPVICVATTCLDAIDTIDRTILSVVTQAGDFRIRYHIQDAGSTDGTCDRLAWWAQRLSTHDFPRQCHGIAFSYASAPDQGMYDGLVRALKKFETVPPNAFLTWINADDILMPGALALAAMVERQFHPKEISWFGGAVAILRDDVVSACVDRPMAIQALRAGVCDGAHWSFLQQEGTFFRRWLWSAVTPQETIAPMRLAGDWNLWRLFAEKASFAQVPQPLGASRFREGQLSNALLERSMAEIDAIVPAEERRRRFLELCRPGAATRRRIVTGGAGPFKLLVESAEPQARHRYFAALGAYPAWPEAPRTEPAVQATGRAVQTTPIVRLSIDIDADLRSGEGWSALDADWQFPAITEKHAFHKVAGALRAPKDVRYVGYPWATLIDKVQNRSADAEDHLHRFRAFVSRLPASAKRITVCQHILMPHYRHLFEEAGVTDVFWAHATRASPWRDAPGAPTIHPFPLYPVQRAVDLAGERPHLFSFIGARGNKWYLTQARNWILDALSADPRGLVRGRDAWHYQKVVYDHQVRGSAGKGDPLVDDQASAEFRESLQRSVFSLCPSGSGPNSIRLWESLGAGAIPVILADTWLPPGNPALWEAAAVFCAETEEAVRALPDRLAEIAADPARLEAMRHAGRQLWLLYGPDNFVHDIHRLMLSLDGVGDPAPPPTAAPDTPEKARMLLLSETGRLLQSLGAQTATTVAAPDPAAWRAAWDSLPPDDPLASHAERVLDHVRDRIPLAAPAVNAGEVPRICLFGRHANRTPLSYEPFRRLIGDRLVFVDDPATADLVVTGFNLDFRENAETLGRLLQRRPALKAAVLSEEPLWDVAWSGGIVEREREQPVPGGVLRYTVLSHVTSSIFDFVHLPYFPLTNDSFSAIYAARMAHYAAMRPADLLEQWRKAPIRAAFFAEKRRGESYARAYPEKGVWGLSDYRTAVAEAAGASPDVLRVGKGWAGDMPRQQLPDWHLDKLATLDGRTRLCSAIENTHHRCYLTEKLFDPFAVGAIPIYHADPSHRVWELVPSTAMINTFGTDPAGLAPLLDALDPDTILAEAWLDTVERLRERFSNISAIVGERLRVAEACLHEISQLV